MPRLLLVNPSHGHSHLGSTSSHTWPPLHLPYLAAVTPKHYHIEVIDENVESFSLKKADIVGITAYTSSINRAYQIAGMYHEKGIPTIMGGIHVSMMPDEAMRFCDAVVIGEAEDIWPKVLEDFETNRLQKKYIGSLIDLDTLPIPRRDILRNPYYRWGSIQTSRGCPMNCSFCSVTAFNGRRYRRRPLESVIEELEQIPQKWISINDDNIIGYGEKDREWAYAFFSQIIKKRIRKYYFAQVSIQFGEDLELIKLAAKAGVKIVFTGIESVNPETLNSYKKNLNLERLHRGQYVELIKQIRKQGIVLLGGFVLGSDSDDRSVFHSTLKLIRSSHIDILQASKLTPLPGTQLWKSLQQEGRIINNNFPDDWEEFRFSRLVFKPKKMDIEEAYEGFTYLRKMYYSFWETIRRTLNTFFTTKSLLSTILAYKFNQGYKKPFKNSVHYSLYNQPGLKKKFQS